MRKEETMNYRRNNDLNYYNEYRDYANCGSYALRLEGWYDPEDYFYFLHGSICEWIEEQLEFYDEYDIANFYAADLIEGMLQEFDGELRLINSYSEVKANEELVLFSTFCSHNLDYDFHFKVFRDGKWMEKNGTGEVHECSDEEWGKYISDVWCLAHKIK